MNRLGGCAVLALALVAAGCAALPAGPGGPGADDLAGTWRIASYLGADDRAVAPLAGTGPFLSFGTDGRLGGTAGCNSFGADYRAGNGRLSVGPVVTTLMYCEAPGVMDQEARVLSLLSLAEEFRLDGDALVLLDAGGRAVMTLARAPAPPPTGSA
ncbi:MAG: META domain-containing protein [Methanospirillum sp.]|nr:META domain-containing protein [Methanospirillum sp.]